MDKSSIACIGETKNVNLFNALGIKTFILSDLKEVDTTIYHLSKDGIKIIYVSENIYSSIPEVLEKYANKTYPIILPIPLDEASNGVGLKKIKDNVEKAIGIDIF